MGNIIRLHSLFKGNMQRFCSCISLSKKTKSVCCEGFSLDGTNFYCCNTSRYGRARGALPHRHPPCAPADSCKTYQNAGHQKTNETGTVLPGEGRGLSEQYREVLLGKTNIPQVQLITPPVNHVLFFERMGRG